MSKYILYCIGANATAVFGANYTYTYDFFGNCINSILTPYSFSYGSPQAAAILHLKNAARMINAAGNVVQSNSEFIISGCMLYINNIY